MLEHQGVWLPDGETHMTEWMTRNGEIVDGKGSYQIKKLRKALSYCRNFRTAVDVGGHVGFWSMHLVKRFATVHAFEPVSAHRDCFVRNVDGATLHACALGANEGSVSMYSVPTSSGNTTVAGAGEIPMHMLDSFNLQDVDFVKLDCEGYELHALVGGKETILRCQPTIIVEQKPGKAGQFGLAETGAVTFLQSLGYRVAECLSGDYICVPA